MNELEKVFNEIDTLKNQLENVQQEIILKENDVRNKDLEIKRLGEIVEKQTESYSELLKEKVKKLLKS